MVRVKAQVNGGDKFFDGMNVRISVKRSVPNQIVVPKTAIVLRSGKQVMSTVKDNIAMWNYVTTGLENLTEYTLTNWEASGLQEAIIFFTTSILFNSLKQPLAIIFVIPISYIGVFLTFYLFGLNFDQGGFASFVLLCGITVNVSIYIMNEYNDVRRRFPKLIPVRAYVKSWNAKIIPIFLTIVSTIFRIHSVHSRYGKRSLLVSVGSRYDWRFDYVYYRNFHIFAYIYAENIK